MAQSIKDKVAIIGMGSSRFGNLQELGVPDLEIDAVYEACKDAKVDLEDIPFAWVGFVISGGTGQMLTVPVKPLQYRMSTHLDAGNSTGLAALRLAAFGVLSRVYDIGLAVGVERSTAYGWQSGPPFPVTGSCHMGLRDSFSGAVPSVTPAGQHAMFATRYFAKYGISPEEGKKLLAMVTVKNRHNGSLNPKAYLQSEVTLDEVLQAPLIAWPLGLLDYAPPCDGAAAAIVVRAEDAKKYRPNPVFIKALELDVDVTDRYASDSDFTSVGASQRVVSKAYQVAGVKNPRAEIGVAEVDDLSAALEIICLEDAGLSPRGKAKEDIESGFFNLEGGALPTQPDGGTMCCGDALGATALRQVYEVYLQLQGRADVRQVAVPKLGLVQNTGSILELTSPNASCAILGL